MKCCGGSVDDPAPSLLDLAAKAALAAASAADCRHARLFASSTVSLQVRMRQVPRGGGGAGSGEPLDEESCDERGEESCDEVCGE